MGLMAALSVGAGMGQAGPGCQPFGLVLRYRFSALSIDTFRWAAIDTGQAGPFVACDGMAPFAAQALRLLLR
ncbi:hypothetical protein TSH100_06700 [Azospirillum sp. TSH100]|nr:hypothetical protein TSH100_06700 [Azospirillum sp. TSH100]